MTTMMLNIGEYIINPQNIAYMEVWLGDDGLSKGTRIVYNAYAGAANVSDWAYVPLSIEIFGLTPINIMDYINNELDSING